MAISSWKRAGRRRLPRQWLFTDERLGGLRAEDPLWRAIAALPRRAGIVFRHYGWPPEQRLRLFRQLLAVARLKALLVVASGLPDAGPGADLGDGVHRPAGSRARRRRGLLTAAAHNEGEIRCAFRRRADLVFLSPVFATASHPGAAVLGPRRFGRMARRAPGPVVALGGMDAARARLLRRLGAFGHAGIDCWAAPASPARANAQSPKSCADKA